MRARSPSRGLTIVATNTHTQRHRETLSRHTQPQGTTTTTTDSCCSRAHALESVSSPIRARVLFRVQVQVNKRNRFKLKDFRQVQAALPFLLLLLLSELVNYYLMTDEIENKFKANYRLNENAINCGA